MHESSNSDPSHLPMRHNATECDTFQSDAAALTSEMPHSTRLSPVQVKAAEMLLRGLSTRKVAEKLGIHRSTIHRWRIADPHFIAYTNVRLSALAANASMSTHRILNRALRCVESAFRDEDCVTVEEALRVLSVLRVSRLLNQQLPHDPEDIAAELGIETSP